eukprot:Colp12_sorted_trinity150504_noHs@28723
MAEEQQAKDYLSEHRILDLFENITANLIYEKPDDPKRFIVDYLTNLKNVRLSAGKVHPAPMFTDEDLVALFRLFDVSKKGKITLAQYTEAMKDLGLTEFEKVPSGVEGGFVNLQVFQKEATAALQKYYATYVTPA